ncbi:hypothetical protein B6D12_05970 [Gilliamella apicola]|uniref:hypothetical protein n=1 Tax=Gilliamella apicola TaxID=1196095 RepID=UPI000A32E3C3|nr:hypothetical protein [Gilliamella apicola]OTP90517.1 hypothetical protein B5S41_03800 [Gilliamella apicola]OTQ05711.1 hypothetical protein B6D12_05970 [Gilliamella apicola]
MSMRSTIGVKVGNEYRTVYCHLDGYPSGVGITLLNHYNSQELAEELVKEGDIVSLGKARSCQEEHSHKNEIDGYTVYYGRDLGEKGTKYITSEERPKLEEDFLYIFENGKWFVSSIYFEDQTQELTQELIDSEE